MMMPATDNSRIVHQSSLAVLPAETSVGKWEEWTKDCEFYLFIIEIPQAIFNIL
jgi:hypothetical protein